MPPARTAVLGGTFDRLHHGHAALLDAAVRSAGTVRIGLTTERYLSAHPKPFGPRIRPFATRRRALRRYLRRTYPGRQFDIVPLNDGVGRAAEPGVDVLVVSSETLAGAKAVNRVRRERGLPPVELVVVPLVLSDDLRAVSSRRIRGGRLTLAGRAVGPTVVELVGVPPRDWSEVETAFATALPNVRVLTRAPTEVTPGGSEGWDYRLTLPPPGPRSRLAELTTPEGTVARFPRPRTSEALRRSLVRALHARTAAYAHQRLSRPDPVSRRWKRTSASRSIAK